MIKRVLFAIVWCVVLYFAGCALVGGIAGGIASARLERGQDAYSVGAAAGARVVEASRMFIGVAAAVLSILGAYFGFLPGCSVAVPIAADSGLPRDMQRWARTRQLGRSKYIWLCGVIYWGLTTGFLWSMFMAALQGWHRWPLLLVIAMVGFPIGGYFFGTTMWKKMETKYQQEMSTHSLNEN